MNPRWPSQPGYSVSRATIYRALERVHPERGKETDWADQWEYLQTLHRLQYGSEIRFGQNSANTTARSGAGTGFFWRSPTIGAFREFKVLLEKRGLLTESSQISYELIEAEYPLSELCRYFQNEGLLTDWRAAIIFARFTRDKMRTLRDIAEEIDAEYDNDLAES